jgi:hypothetical protein
MDAEAAVRFAEEWEAAWNAHDLDRLLSHYTDDVVFQSPYIVHRLHEPSGEAQPELAFTVDGIRLSVDTLVINYRNERGHAISEVLRFRDGLVCWACGAYAPGAALITPTGREPQA